MPLDRKIGDATVARDKRDVDRYGRLVAVCSSRGADLNAWLVREGWAVYRRYSTAYFGAEDATRAAELGVWAGSFDVPWDWRRAS